MGLTSKRACTWSAAEKQYVIDQFNKGYSYTQIANALGHGRTRNSVSGLLRRMRSGDCHNRAKPREQGVPIAMMRRIDQVAELLSDGFALSDIAEELGISRKAVVSCFKRIRAGLGAQAI
jgi:hypothetical protein